MFYSGEILTCFLVGIYYEYYCIIGSEFFFGKIISGFFLLASKNKMSFFFLSDMSIFIYEMIIILVIKIVMNAVTTIS